MYVIQCNAYVASHDIPDEDLLGVCANANDTFFGTGIAIYSSHAEYLPLLLGRSDRSQSPSPD